jgi:uncharacterized membrane protein YfcA
MDGHNLLLLVVIGMLSFVLSFYGSAVGLVLGHLRLPLLIYCLPSTAAGMATSLITSALGALTGTVGHARDGRLSFRLLILMGIPSIIGAALGGVLLVKIDSAWARLVLGVFLVGTGANLVLAKAPENYRSAVLKKTQALLEIVIGLALGVLSSLTGLMLGSLRLPFLIRCLKVDPRVAVGTNMAIGCITAGAGAAALWQNGRNFFLLPILIIAPPTILGGYLGARCTGRFRKEALQRLVGATIVLTGLGMTCEGIWKTLPRRSIAPEIHEVALRPVSFEDRPIDYNRDIRPILSNHCYACHGPDSKKRKAGLRLDRREDAIAELRSGSHAIVAGDRSSSELILRLKTSEDGARMPPAKTGKRLSAAEIELLGKWIDQGAPWAAHWAYQTPIRPKLPHVSARDWARNEIDLFVLERLEKEGVEPAAEADPVTLLRRLSFDLTGLPPTLAEVDAFLADQSPNAYEKVVDRLLSSPHYGERMAQSWLDLARYADTNGYRLDNHRDMWPYRDWVIAAFNQNMPFDRFTIAQLAGDLLPEATLSERIATGFHRNTMVNYGNGSDPEEYRTKAVMDRVNTTATVWLGTTLACAQCHNHKYDPFTQEDYYRFFAFFNNVPEKGLDGNKSNPVPVIPAPAPEQMRRLAAIRCRLTEIELSREADRDYDRLKRAEADLLEAIPMAMVMEEMPQPRKAHVLLGGDYQRKAAAVTANVPVALPPLLREMPNRLGLAHWLVHPSNPLTARVTVNRFWQMYFGAGLVKTSDDFGFQGEMPSHPELLDWLATEFIAHKWDIKAVQKLIVMSATYRQSSTLRPLVERNSFHSTDLAARDPLNRLLARGPRSRLDAEMIRDNALAVSGLLCRTIGGPSVRPYQPAGLWEQVAVGGNYTSQTYVQDHGTDLFRRGLYTYWKRALPYPAQAIFDAPTREVCAVERPRTNTPLQALVLLNDPTFVEAARALAERVLNNDARTSAQRLTFAFRLCTNRVPSTQELEILARVLDQQMLKYREDKEAARALIQVGESKPARSFDTGELAAWTAVANMLLNLDETISKG